MTSTEPSAVLCDPGLCPDGLPCTNSNDPVPAVMCANRSLKGLQGTSDHTGPLAPKLETRRGRAPASER